MIYSKGKRLVVVVGDIEMAGGGVVDDFSTTEVIEQFILSYNTNEYHDCEVDLVFNGDTFDFLKMSVEGRFPHLIDSKIGQNKLRQISKAHSGFFEAIGKFIDTGNRARRVHFIVGNHDMELLFPEVQRDLVELCGGSGQILFPGFTLQIGDIHIEHGNQLDTLFSVDTENLFIYRGNEKYLNLPWTSVTILNAMMPYHHEFYQLDRVKPRPILLEELPMIKDFILGQLWTYWTKDYLKEYLRTNDPLKKVSWSMLKEAVKRSFLFNPDVEIHDRLEKQMKLNRDTKIYIVGHLHEQRIESYGDRKLMQMGCFRDEYMYDEVTKTFQLIPKNYAHVWMEKGKCLLSESREVKADLGDHVEKPRELSIFGEKLNSLLDQAEQGKSLSNKDH